MPARMTKIRKTIETCPLCELPLSQPLMACPDCGRNYHQSCWSQNTGCVNFGCASTGVTAPVSTKPDQAADAKPEPSKEEAVAGQTSMDEAIVPEPMTPKETQSDKKAAVLVEGTKSEPGNSESELSAAAISTQVTATVNDGNPGAITNTKPDALEPVPGPPTVHSSRIPFLEPNTVMAGLGILVAVFVALLGLALLNRPASEVAKSPRHVQTPRRNATADTREVKAELQAKEKEVTNTVAKTSTRAAIETDKGRIVIELYPDAAPKTVDNFRTLVSKDFYNGLTFHRVVPGFVIQGGDPNSRNSDPDDDGTGGPGYTVPAEFNDKPHIRGTVAMARAQDPDSAGSQFYIALGRLEALDGQYTVFGQVVEGLEVIDKIAVGDKMNRIYLEPVGSN